MAKKKAKKTARERAISSCETKIKNRRKKLADMKAEYEKARQEVQDELDEQVELLEALRGKA